MNIQTQTGKDRMRKKNYKLFSFLNKDAMISNKILLKQIQQFVYKVKIMTKLSLFQE